MRRVEEIGPQMSSRVTIMKNPWIGKYTQAGHSSILIEKPRHDQRIEDGFHHRHRHRDRQKSRYENWR